MQQLNIYKIVVSQLDTTLVNKYSQMSNLSIFPTRQIICVICEVAFFFFTI